MSDETKNRKIALLGTSADPPTCGHQALLQGLLTLFPRVATWASNNPMKEHKANLVKRHEMLKVLVDWISHPGLELVQDLSSPLALITLKKAKILWPNAELTFVIGSDLTNQIPTWVKAKEVLNIARIGIAPRQGWPVSKQQLETLQSLGGRIDILPLQIPATASSMIREESNTSDIPIAILPMLLEQNLYGLTTNK